MPRIVAQLYVDAEVQEGEGPQEAVARAIETYARQLRSGEAMLANGDDEDADQIICDTSTVH